MHAIQVEMTRHEADKIAAQLERDERGAGEVETVDQSGMSVYKTQADFDRDVIVPRILDALKGASAEGGEVEMVRLHPIEASFLLNEIPMMESAGDPSWEDSAKRITEQIRGCYPERGEQEKRVEEFRLKAEGLAYINYSPMAKCQECGEMLMGLFDGVEVEPRPVGQTFLHYDRRCIITCQKCGRKYVSRWD